LLANFLLNPPELNWRSDREVPERRKGLVLVAVRFAAELALWDSASLLEEEGHPG
jgi:hypothetical protein